eukprot:364857-Chlamydomonas_euryale.AAC.11
MRGCTVLAARAGMHSPPDSVERACASALVPRLHGSGGQALVRVPRRMTASFCPPSCPFFPPPTLPPTRGRILRKRLPDSSAHVLLQCGASVARP